MNQGNGEAVFPVPLDELRGEARLRRLEECVGAWRRDRRINPPEPGDQTDQDEPDDERMAALDAWLSETIGDIELWPSIFRRARAAARDDGITPEETDRQAQELEAAISCLTPDQKRKTERVAVGLLAVEFSKPYIFDPPAWLIANPRRIAARLKFMAPPVPNGEEGGEP